MPVLSVAEARAFLPGSPLTDAAITMAIEDIEAEIVDRFGAYYPGPETELLYPPDAARDFLVGDDWRRGIRRGDYTLVLRRPIASITSVVEYLGALGSGTPTRTLDPSDFRIRGRFFLDRLSSGVNPASGWSRWGTTIVYVPVDDTARRKMATVDALKEEASFSGLSSRRLGDYSETKGSGAGGGDTVSIARSKILRRLRPKAMVLR